jgi:hypothetical protein
MTSKPQSHSLLKNKCLAIPPARHNLLFQAQHHPQGSKTLGKMHKVPKRPHGNCSNQRQSWNTKPTRILKTQPCLSTGAQAPLIMTPTPTKDLPAGMMRKHQTQLATTTRTASMTTSATGSHRITSHIKLAITYSPLHAN